MDRVQLSTVGTVCGAMVLLFCVLYEHYRRKDLNFKKKLQKRRLDMQRSSSIDLKRIYDPREQQAYILHEVELAEELMCRDQIDDAIQHFANAIIICEDPENIIRALQYSLPPKAYSLMLEMLANQYGNKFRKFLEKDKKTSRIPRLRPF